MQTPSILLPLDCLLPSRSFFSFHTNLSLFWTVPTSPTRSFSLFFLVFHSRFLLFQVLYSNDRINRWLLVYCYSTVLHFICFSLVLFRHWCTTYIQTLHRERFRGHPAGCATLCRMSFFFFFLCLVCAIRYTAFRYAIVAASVNITSFSDYAHCALMPYNSRSRF